MSKAKDVEKEGEVKIDVDGEVFPSVLEEDGAEYTEKSFQFDNIVGYARTNEGTGLLHGSMPLWWTIKTLSIGSLWTTLTKYQSQQKRLTEVVEVEGERTEVKMDQKSLVLTFERFTDFASFFSQKTQNIFKFE